MRTARRWVKWVGVVGVLGFALLNGAAYLHARAIMNFAAGGTRTEPPERLSMTGKVMTLLTGVTVPRPENQVTPATFGMAFETHRIEDRDGWLEAWVIRRPAAERWAVLFHGYAATKTQVLNVADRLHELGFALVLVDFHGSGGSSGTSHSLGFHEARAVTTTLRWAARTLGAHAPLVYGVSMGGAAVLRAQATGSPRAGALIVESVFDRMLTTVGHRFHGMGLPSFPAAQLLVFWGGVGAGFNGFAHNPVEYARHVRCPTLVLQGARDLRVRVEEGRAIYQQLRGPKRWHVAATGHGVSDGMEPGAWRSLVAGFLEMAPSGPKG